MMRSEPNVELLHSRQSLLSSVDADSKRTSGGHLDIGTDAIHEVLAQIALF